MRIHYSRVTRSGSVIEGFSCDADRYVIEPCGALTFQSYIDGAYVNELTRAPGTWDNVVIDPEE